MKTIFTSLLAFVCLSTFAFSPFISYHSPQVYTLDVAIQALTPVNAGGAVSVYGTVSTIGAVGGQGQGLVFNTERTVLYAALSQAFKVNQIAMPYTLGLLAGSGVKGSADGTGETAQFSQAYGIARHPLTGEIYVSDADSSVIKKINPESGEVTNYAGIKGIAATLDGDISIARFSAPRGLAFDENGNLYVAQTGSGAIRKISADGTTVSTLVGNTIVDGITTVYFTNGWNIAYHNGYVYVTEVTGNKVSKVDIMTGAVTVLAGSGSAGSVDGTGASATFNQPRGIDVDADGVVYVADYGNNKIRKITPEGVVTTVAGTGTNVTTDGIGELAAFRVPAGVTLDGLGNLYVCDAASQLIRKVVIDINPNANPYSISPALPAGLTLNTQTGVISGTPTSVTAATDYTITATNASGSSQAVLNIAVNLPSGLGDVDVNSLRISSIKNLEIRVMGEVGKNAIATLYNVQGKMLFTENLKEGNLNTIPTPNIKDGMYLLSVKDNNGSQLIKVLVR